MVCNLKDAELVRQKLPSFSVISLSLEKTCIKLISSIFGTYLISSIIPRKVAVTKFLLKFLLCFFDAIYYVTFEIPNGSLFSH